MSAVLHQIILVCRHPGQGKSHRAESLEREHAFEIEVVNRTYRWRGKPLSPAELASLRVAGANSIAGRQRVVRSPLSTS
jgi:hypothetical protein